MNWYYVENGQQAGPVDEAQLEALRASGKVQPDTLIWSEGMANWQAYGQVKGAAAAPAAIPAAPPLAASPMTATAGPAVLAHEAVCAECGKVFPASEVIRYGDKSICATCKPLFFQRVREGAAFAASPSGVTEADLLARDYQVDIAASFSRGWDTFKANAGILIGGSILVYLGLIVVNVVPYLSIITGLLCTGPLMAGLWYLYIKSVRKQAPGIGDAFSGFGPQFWQLVLTQIVQGVLAGAVFAIGMMLMVFPIMLAAQRGRAGMSSPPSAGMLIPLGLVVLVGMLVMIYLNTCWLFALPLVRDKGLKFWPAMQLSRRVVCKHWWMTFWLMVVAGLFTMVGALACLVGVLLTAPVAFAMLASHYEKVFGDLAPSRN